MTKEGREFAWLFLRLAVGAMMFGLHGWARLGKLYAYFILGQPWSFVSLVQRIGFPMPAVFAVAGIVGFFSVFNKKPSVLNWEKGRDMVQKAWTSDITKAKTELGYRETIGLENGIRETIGWYRKEGWMKLGR